jgi:branched-chain amino acid transport system ATP-binding protein
MTEPLLKVRSLATGYGDLRVVWDVSLDVRPGEITALMGRNGAGKTTTIRAIAGLNPVHHGTIELDGRDLTGVRAHKRVGRGISYVQEGKRLFRGQTVEENLLLGGYALRTSRTRLRPQVQAVYELFPVLGQKRSEPAGSLSGGQQQMVAIGQALMARPTVLMLDEPSGGLAPSVVQEVMSRVAALKETGMGVLLVEQAVEAALGVADNAVVLDIGRVVHAAEVNGLDDVDKIKAAYLGQQPVGD